MDWWYALKYFPIGSTISAYFFKLAASSLSIRKYSSVHVSVSSCLVICNNDFPFSSCVLQMIRKVIRLSLRVWALQHLLAIIKWLKKFGVYSYCCDSEKSFNTNVHEYWTHTHTRARAQLWLRVFLMGMLQCKIQKPPSVSSFPKLYGVSDTYWTL